MDVKNPGVDAYLRDKDNNTINNTKPSSNASYNIDGCLGILSKRGKITPQDELVGIPNNSELMKFPILPKKRPIGTYRTVKSDNCKKPRLIDFRNK